MLKNLVKKFGLKRIFTIFLLVIILLIFLTLSKGTRAILFVLTFIILNTILTLYKRYVKNLPIEFELLTLGIVLCSVSFGLNAGLIVAILGGISYILFSTNFSPFSIPMLLGYIFMAFFSAYFSNINIIYLGILANLIHNLFVFSIYHLAFGYDLLKNILFSLSNILFNIILFYNLAPILIRIMI